MFFTVFISTVYIYILDIYTVVFVRFEEPLDVFIPT